MKNKLIELLRAGEREFAKECRKHFDCKECSCFIFGYSPNCLDALTADYLLANGVTMIPETGIEDMSDGYHTFKDLYYQRMMLTAALVKAYKPLAWKSHRHEDGELCFGVGWFIVGITTPQGDYTYHYEDKYWDLFECEELPVGKPWDGHTEKDVTRLLSLAPEPPKEDKK